MFVRVHPDGSGWTLEESGNLRQFHVEAGGHDSAAVAAALGDPALVAGEDHVWVPIDAVRAAAGSPDAEWEDGFAAMVGFASANGWLDETGTRIKAHLR